MKYAIVDLGSNTIRLSVYETLSGADFKLLFSQKEMAGLVNYIHDGVLSKVGIHRACMVIGSFRELLKQFGIDDLHVFATASLRNIRNTEDAVNDIVRITGADVDVLSGEQEAELSYYGSLRTMDLSTGAMFDIGGGSTEIVEVRNSRILRAQSLPLGSLNLFNRYISGIWPEKKELKALTKGVEAALDAANLPGNMHRICGVGGTARAVLMIADTWLDRSEYERRLSRKDLHQVKKALLKQDDAAKKLILNICPDRVHTILPGLLLMDAVCDALGGEDIYISRTGVREGYLSHKLMSPAET